MRYRYSAKRPPSVFRILMLLVMLGIGVKSLIQEVRNGTIESSAFLVVWCLAVLGFIVLEAKAWWKQRNQKDDELPSYDDALPNGDDRSYCPYCGKRTKPDYEFCDRCGKYLP